MTGKSQSTIHGAPEITPSARHWRWYESQAGTDMINHIEQRISIVETLVAQEKLELPDGLNVRRSKLAEVSEFVASGGVGYALMIGKKPRLPA